MGQTFGSGRRAGPLAASFDGADPHAGGARTPPGRRPPRQSRGPALRGAQRRDRRTSKQTKSPCTRSATSHTVPSPWRGRRWGLVTIEPLRSRCSGGRGPEAPFGTAGRPTTPVSRSGEASDRPRTFGGTVRIGGDARPWAPARRQPLPRCPPRAPFSAPDEVRSGRVRSGTGPILQWQYKTSKSFLVLLY